VKEKAITVILPAAGDGTRLGLNSPKELLEILPGMRLIDFSLKHIQAIFPKKAIRVAVVIRPWKAKVAEYVASQLPGIKVETILFNDKYQEWPGSVYSAKEVFSPNNLVLLPDSYLQISESVPLENPALTKTGKEKLIRRVLNSLSLYPVVFGYKTCTNKKQLSSLGAVRVEKNVITAFCDKPPIDRCKESFNAFWGCYAFKKEWGKALYDFLIASVHQHPVEIKQQPFSPPGAFPIVKYYDLGTWENIEKFKKDKGVKK